MKRIALTAIAATLAVAGAASAATNYADQANQHPRDVVISGPTQVTTGTTAMVDANTFYTPFDRAFLGQDKVDVTVFDGDRTADLNAKPAEARYR
jgi:hypothetical protein